ncbi:Protein of unknown function [Bacillus cereus]|nr:Protein of unknown function [Bacillus cereus]
MEISIFGKCRIEKSKISLDNTDSVVLIGEKMAKSGLAPVLDAYSRDSDIRLRAGAFVIKGNTAKEFLKASIPLESIPALGALKEQMQIEALGDMICLY